MMNIFKIRQKYILINRKVEVKGMCVLIYLIKFKIVLPTVLRRTN